MTYVFCNDKLDIMMHHTNIIGNAWEVHDN